MNYTIGIDVGGTFTDCVLIDESGNAFADKSFTVPANPGEGMIQAIANAWNQAGKPLAELLRETQILALGTTSLTNRLVTQNGAKVGLITTKGHEDAVLIGRVMAKTDGLSDEEKTDVLAWSKPEPLVERKLIRGVTERIDYKGQILVPLHHAEVEQTVNELMGEGVEAIAVSLLWSFLNPVHEQWIHDQIKRTHPATYVALSSAVSPTLGEFERTNATILSAYLGPAARHDIGAIKNLFTAQGFARPLLVMQSNGGTMWDEVVADRPLNVLSSGPVGGIVGCAKLGEQLGYQDIVATDMGGTSFDVGVIVGSRPLISDMSVLNRYRIALPQIENMSIGAGGGSIAWVDPATKELQVGPQSAGAVPGPICYDEGGEEPTVTDANVVLGRIDPDHFFNRRKRLNKEKAEAVLTKRICDALGLELFQAAKGILDIVDARMGDLIRKLTVERGLDPRELVLFAYGGAGATHVAKFAKEAGITKAVVPIHSSVFSALGISSSDIVQTYSRSDPLRSPFVAPRLNETFREILQEAQEGVRRAGLADMQTSFQKFVDMRFRHQVHQLRVPVPDGDVTSSGVDDVVNQFVMLYELRLGRDTAVAEAGVEILTFHVVATTPHSNVIIKKSEPQGTDPTSALLGHREVGFDDGFEATSVFDYRRLVSGNIVSGPAVIEGANTTVLIPPGQQASLDPWGNIVLHL